MIVRKLRLQRGWSQEQLAELAGLNVRTIQRIERGKPASLETRAALAAVFEVDISTFEAEETPMESQPTVTPEEKRAIEYVKGIKEFWGHVSGFVLFALIFGFVFGFDFPVIRWIILGWGFGLIVHGLNAYEVINLFGPEWERRQVEKRLGRKL